MGDLAATRLRARAVSIANEWVQLCVLSIGIAVFYLVLRAPVLNPPRGIDPWFYTGSFVNFRYLYQALGGTYYPSRLPWIVPGVAVHAVFGPTVAYFVLHATYYFGGGLFAYLLIRRFFGRAVALASYALLMLTPLFYNAYVDDYPDGALLTYLFAGGYFGLTASGSRRPWLRSIAAGFFLAAAVGTNLFAGVIIAFLLIVFAFVRIDALRAPRMLVMELAFGLVGVAALLVACGSFSLAYGGRFLFFMPQIRELGYLSTSSYKTSGAAWVLHEPQLALPAFAAVCAGILVTARLRGALRSHFDLSARFAVGAVLSTLLFYGTMVLWEFAFTGDFLEYSFYFTLFNVGITLSFAATLYYLGLRDGAVAFVVVAAAVPTVLSFPFAVLPSGRTGAAIVIVLMAVVTVAIAVRPLTRSFAGPVAATAVAALVAFTATYAADAGYMTRTDFARNTFSERRDVQSVALQLVSFMRSHAVQDAPFLFWDNENDDPSLRGIQSMYLWGDTAAGRDLPRIDRSMRRALANTKPSALVLLCVTRTCHHAAASLTAAGYPNRPLASQLLTAGDVHIWVRAFTMPKFAALNRPHDTTIDFYRQGASPFVDAPAGKALATTSFAHGVADGWSGAAVAAAAGGAPFETSSTMWAYELQGPYVTLPPGKYTVYARGRVLAGGLDLGVLNADANVWLQQRFYWYGQRQRFAKGWMATPFELPARTKIEVILSNWVPREATSRWQLDEIEIARTP